MDRLAKYWSAEKTRELIVAAFVVLWIVIALYLHLFVIYPEAHVALLYAIPIVLAGQFTRPRLATGLIILAIIAHSVDAIYDQDPFLLWSAQGVVLGIIGFLAVRGKEQERAEARLSAELDATVASIAEGLLIYNAAGELVRTNAAAEEILGYTLEERRRPIAERLRALRVETPEGRVLEPGETPPLRALRGETVRGALLALHPPRAKPVWIYATAAPVRLADGTLLGAAVTMTDVTRLRALQEQREDLLRSVSHDLRSPLTVILGQAQLLEQGLEKAGVDGLQRKSASAIASEARRMNVMIQDLVDSARMEAGQLRLDRKAVDLRSFVSDLLQRASLVLDVKRVKADIPAGLPPISADPNRLERILLNLLSNALKYSYPGTEVRITARVVDGAVAVAVSDRGPGIAPEDLPHLFERFYRARAARGTEGIGLGLFTVKALVEAHGGRVWAESELGRGSIFTFEMPISS